VHISLLVIHFAENGIKSFVSLKSLTLIIRRFKSEAQGSTTAETEEDATLHNKETER
jgi:hypothetical protein